MAQQARQLTLAHELDAAWIIALWKAIHGGDPAPGEIQVDARSAELVGELVDHLGQTVGRGAQPLTQATFGARLGQLGIQMQRHAAAGAPAQAALSDPVAIEPPPYCFVFQGTSYCVHFPRRVHALQ